MIWNWRRIRFFQSGIDFVCLGFSAGVCGASLAVLSDTLWNNDVIKAGILGLGMLPLLCSANDIAYGHWRRFRRNLLLSLILGPLIGAAVGFVAVALHAAIPLGDRWWSSPYVPLLGILAALSGFISGSVHPSWRHGKRRSLRTGLWGVLAAWPLSYIISSYNNLPLEIVAFGIWGSVIALASFWSERIVARRWVRLLNGKYPDVVYPLSGKQLSIGQLPTNDVVLRGFSQILPIHCIIQRNVQGYLIEDNFQEGRVRVNFRKPKQHELRSGDLIQIGGALLQYGSKK